MSPADFVLYLRDLFYTFCRVVLKASINAQQIIAHWRIRVRRENHNNERNPQSTNVELTQQSPESETYERYKEEGILSSPSTQKYQSFQDNHKDQYKISTTSDGKTSNSRRTKFYSILHRLSLRNFMEYCVIALNEASSSSRSNKLDLTSSDKPVWLLGQHYELPCDAEELVDDIRSKLWITYRRNFPPIDGNTRYTTDMGFGCMIRCGQMVLANALVRKNLGRAWRWLPGGFESNPIVYSKILRLFQDKFESPYSIHNIINAGQQEGKVVGEWFGPNTIAQALKRMSASLSVLEQVDNELLISIDAALDNVVVIEEVKAKFKNGYMNNLNISETNQSREEDNKHTSQKWTPGILFIQLRLGLTKINPLYFAALKKTFQLKNSLGIIGGRPNHALYLVGHTEDDIIYLDPHNTQQYIDLDDNADLDDRSNDEATKANPIDSTYHCTYPEKMPIDRLDPSLALCFYFHSEEEFDIWRQRSQEMLIKSEQAPMFEIMDSRPIDWDKPVVATSVKSTQVNTNHTNAAEHGDDGTNICGKMSLDKIKGDKVEAKNSNNYQASDDEEFEMLG